MLESNHQLEVSSSAVRKWENAGELLADSLSSYLRSCMFLEAFASADGINSQYLASRIDLSLTSLHTKLATELAQSRVILARIRNKTSSRFNSLPNEIVAAIFSDVVFVPASHDPSHPSMDGALLRMYGRLYTLLSVCVSWRSIGVELAELWSVIPMDSDPQGSPSRYSTSLILDRSQASSPNDRPLHLAAILSTDYDSYLPLVGGKLPRFTSINIKCEDIDIIFSLIAELLRHPSDLTVSELSIHHVHEDEGVESLPRPPEDFIASYPSVDLRLFNEMISSLSILRIRGISFGWDEFPVTNKLVELRLQSMVFGDRFELAHFLSTLQSASELQILNIISIFTLCDLEQPVSTDPPGAILSFPKLQTLLLENLDYTTLWITLSSITSGSHRTKLFLTPKSLLIYGPEEEEDGVNIQLYYALLENSTVETLIIVGNLGASNWLNDTMLRRILQSLPAVKTLKIGSWNLNTQSLQALERPQSTVTKPKPKPFPNLNTLCITNSYIRDAEALSRVVTSHSLQTLVLDDDYQIQRLGTDSGMASMQTTTGNWDPLLDDGPLVQQFRASISHFRLFQSILEDEDFNQDVWSLW